MFSIAQANIDRFELLLQTELSPTKRSMIVRLLAEQQDEKRNAAAKPGWPDQRQPAT